MMRPATASKKPTTAAGIKKTGAVARPGTAPSARKPVASTAKTDSKKKKKKPSIAVAAAPSPRPQPQPTTPQETEHKKDEKKEPGVLLREAVAGCCGDVTKMLLLKRELDSALRSAVFGSDEELERAAQRKTEEGVEAQLAAQRKEHADAIAKLQQECTTTTTELRSQLEALGRRAEKAEAEAAALRAQPAPAPTIAEPTPMTTIAAKTPAEILAAARERAEKIRKEREEAKKLQQ